MSGLRIVSLLPAATEMACALGLADELVGVTHECDHPPEVRQKPSVVKSVLPVAEMRPDEIDQAVCQRIRSGGSLYELDDVLLRELAPTHILAQSLCNVCAPSDAELVRALHTLPGSPCVLQFFPRNLADIRANLLELGEATGRRAEAEELVGSMRRRLQLVSEATGRALVRPRVFCLEWTDPYYCAGHWVPEMVAIAGGVDALGRLGGDSVRVLWSEIEEWAPEILIVMPCGYDADSATRQASELIRNRPEWRNLPAVREGRVFAVDASSYYARPGPRVVDGTELLAHLIHPELWTWNGASRSAIEIHF